MKSLKRFKITHKGSKIVGDLPTKELAETSASEAIILSGYEFLYEVSIDKWGSFKALLRLLLMILYAPIYYIGVIALIFIRIALAFVYIILLKPDMSRNILTHVFIWEKKHLL